MKVTLHIRKGELALSQFAERYLPLQYFEEVLSKLLPILDEFEIEYEVVIPQEQTSAPVHIADPKIQRSISLNPNNPAIRFIDDTHVEIVQESLTSFMPNLISAKWLDPSDPFNDFLEMARADILVISKSSFSFLAGLCNPASIKIFEPFWHATPKAWVDSSNIDRSTVMELLTLE